MASRGPEPSARFAKTADRRNRFALSALIAEASPIDLRILGKTVLHAAAIGVAAGLLGSLFFVLLEYIQRVVLEQVTGYVPLRAEGETFAAGAHRAPFRPWLLLFMPAIGGLVCGLVTRLAPETRGGGGDAMIAAFHSMRGHIRRRVIWVKALASMATLGTGGAGGREGPTMQIGGAIGASIGRLLHVSARERRILMVAGVAAGMSAVFRTPLGAALLAVEVLYSDGFESDALIPAVLASVVAYSVNISIFGESTLFGHVPRFPFHTSELPLFALLAVMIAGLAVAFLSVYRGLGRAFGRLPVPDWVRPAVGGLVLGCVATPAIVLVGRKVHEAGQGLGILGGGYGAVQMAISGSPWLPEGWSAVVLLFVLSVTKLLAASLTIGSGGSAGDFAPSLAIGGLFGGAFGRAAQLLLHDPSIHPGAFALVGMGTFYGGIAHVPLSALVLVCELAGNYDLLVPLMLAQGIAFVALRRRALYHAQVPTQRESPAHRDALMRDALRSVKVADLLKAGPPPRCFSPNTATAEMIRHASDATTQDVFPVVDAAGNMIGLVTTDIMRVLAAEMTDTRWTLAADLMQPVVSVRAEDDAKTAMQLLIDNGLREIPVVTADGRVIGMLDESDIAAAYLLSATRAESQDDVAPDSTGF